MENCTAFNNTKNPELKAYATCLNAESKFFYTIAFLLIPLIFYLTEFLTLTSEYEPTGLRARIAVSLQNSRKSRSGKIGKILIKLLENNSRKSEKKNLENQEKILENQEKN